MAHRRRTLSTLIGWQTVQGWRRDVFVFRQQWEASEAFFKTHNCTLDHRDVAPSSLSLSVKQVLRGEERGCFRSSKLLVNIPGVIHELAAREVFAVLENLVQLQVMVLVFIGDGDHLPGLVQSVVLVHRVHVLLSVAQERHQKKERWRHFSRLDN